MEENSGFSGEEREAGRRLLERCRLRVVVQSLSRAPFTRHRRTPLITGGGLLAIALLFSQCKRPATISASKAREHVELLVAAVRSDLEEVRKGLPEGARLVEPYLLEGKYEEPGESRAILDKARSKVQDLRVAKSTFFALADPRGIVIRSDQEHDSLSGKALFAAFPELKSALSGKYVETRGSLPEASGVRGRKDGQWVAAIGIGEPGNAKGLYVTGWSWSGYAYRLENQLRSSVRSADAEEKDPLVYVYVVVGGEVYGAPISPEVNARAVQNERFLERAKDLVLSEEREITGREFGIAFVRTPALGSDVGIAVLRSET